MALPLNMSSETGLRIFSTGRPYKSDNFKMFIFLTNIKKYFLTTFNLYM